MSKKPIRQKKVSKPSKMIQKKSHCVAGHGACPEVREPVLRKVIIKWLLDCTLQNSAASFQLFIWLVHLFCLMAADCYFFLFIGFVFFLSDLYSFTYL